MELEAVLQTLIQSASGGQWGVLAGAILLVLVSVVRRITADRLVDPAAKWVSASSAMAAATAVSLMAGAVWWHAVILGCFGPVASDGFWRLVGSLIPRRVDG